MPHTSSSDIISSWPEESREAAQLVIDEHGEPDEATESLLIWHDRHPWKRIEATREFSEHHFPIPHTDSVESFIEYSVPPERLPDLAEFDGSVMVQRTEGTASARCHDLEANNLALNLMHDIVKREKTVEQARGYYGEEFLQYRRKQPTPYMDELRVRQQPDSAFKDSRVLSDEDLRRAEEEGARRAA
jgi:hypothetical protein